MDSTITVGGLTIVLETRIIESSLLPLYSSSFKISSLSSFRFHVFYHSIFGRMDPNKVSISVCSEITCRVIELVGEIYDPYILMLSCTDRHWYYTGCGSASWVPYLAEDKWDHHI